jgi:hypothetical protein
MFKMITVSCLMNDTANSQIYTRGPRTRIPKKKGEILIRRQIKVPKEKICSLNGIQNKDIFIRQIRTLYAIQV